MTNPYYAQTGVPVAQSRGVSVSVKSEFGLIQAGFEGVNTQFGGKGNIAGQAWTGTHDYTGATLTMATPAPGDNSTKGATTAFVAATVSAYAPLNSPALTGSPTAPTAAFGTNSSQIATMATLLPYAPLNSPALTGIPTAPTATVGTNSTQIATMAAITNQVLTATLPGQAGKAGSSLITDGSTAFWGAIVIPRNVQNSTYQIMAADGGKHLVLTGGSSVAWTAPNPASISSGWYCIIKNEATTASAVAITLTRFGSETIDGLASIVEYSGGALMLTFDGVNFIATRLSGGVARFTASGTFTMPTRVNGWRTRVTGGGGGGGGGNQDTTNMGAAGGGGGACQQKILTPIATGTTLTITVAAGGTGGAGTNNASTGTGSPGVAGGTSSIAAGGVTYNIAYGGGGGMQSKLSNASYGGGGGGGAGSGTAGLGSGSTPTGGAPAAQVGGAPSFLGTPALPDNVGLGGGGGAGTAGRAEWGGAGGGGVGSAGAGALYGGGGGGGASSATSSDGQAGGACGVYAIGGGGTAGIRGVSPTSGGNGTSRDYACGDGGGGGGCANSGTNNGGNGGNGGSPGGGGGGAGCSTGGTGGNGGTGGRGEVLVDYW
ncbi:hypothetical protein ACO0K9_12255 [Undibacterium sp. Ji50W]|uniref:glycine-rich domain-containing protein n=1 Tax=Undibacterium sp. Ji50W TaxID=3413041 RepID=UPI003BF1F917